MSFFGFDPSKIIDAMGGALHSLAPAPDPQQQFQPSGQPGGGFQPIPNVVGGTFQPVLTMGGQGFQPAQATFAGFDPAGLAGLPGFAPSPGGNTPFQPWGMNPLVNPDEDKRTISTNPLTGGQGGAASYTGLPQGVSQWADRVQQTFGANADIMLAIIQHESGGDPNVQNHAGYPAYGLFQLWEQPGLNVDQQFAAAQKLLNDKLQMINASYQRLGLNPDAETRARDIALAWAGHFDPNTAGPSGSSADIASGETAQAYLYGPNGIMPMYQNIVRGKQQTSGASIPPGPALQTIFGGKNPTPIMQEFGRTPYSVQHPETYDYGKYFGLDGLSHPGVDYAMPVGTSLYVPLDGVVTVVGNDHGTGYYYTDNHGNDPNHSGELAITLANGDIIILGHMSSIALQVGQRVTAGTFAGYSGGSDGDHLHLEVRTQNGSRIVDPRIYFGGR